MTHILSVLVEDKPGVLAHIASMFARRAFNIHSLAVGPSKERGVSRMTLVVDAPALEQLTKQLNKLVNVLKVQELAGDETLEREVMLVRVAAGPGQRGEVVDTASIFAAKTLDVGPNSLTFELTGDSHKVNAFLDLMRPYGISDLVKSGRIALQRDLKARTLEAAG
ncbi:MAG: acetolactate synthase small subunit [Acidimicrobiia bacterium]